MNTLFFIKRDAELRWRKRVTTPREGRMDTEERQGLAVRTAEGHVVGEEGSVRDAGKPAGLMLPWLHYTLGGGGAILAIVAILPATVVHGAGFPLPWTALVGVVAAMLLLP